MANTNKEIVEAINASFAKNEIDGFLKYCADDIKWTMVGEKVTKGKDTVREWLKSMADVEPPKFTVTNLVGEGDVVVANGDMTMKDKDGKTESYSYCDIYNFKNGKVGELTSFVMKTDNAKQSASA